MLLPQLLNVFFFKTHTYAVVRIHDFFPSHIDMCVRIHDFFGQSTEIVAITTHDSFPFVMVDNLKGIFLSTFFLMVVMDTLYF